MHLFVVTIVITVNHKSFLSKHSLYKNSFNHPETPSVFLVTVANASNDPQRTKVESSLKT